MIENGEFMLREYIIRHIEWSRKTFGDGSQSEKICRHIEKELSEIRETPYDLYEWVDVIILGIDGAWRAGYSPLQIIDALSIKQEKNFKREWSLGDGDNPNEHVK